VLVVGAGPVGQFAALLLAQRHVDVAVVDLAPDATRGAAVILHPDTLPLLAEADLLDEAEDVGQRITAVEIVEGTRRSRTVELGKLDGPRAHALTIEAGALTAILERRLARAGVTIGWDRRCADLRSSPGSVAVDIERLEEASTGYAVPHREWEVVGTQELEAAFVIGADGEHSLVRRRLDIPFLGLGEARFALFEGPGDGGETLRVVCGDAGRAVYWPLPGGRWRWLFELAVNGTPAPITHRDELLSSLGAWAIGTYDGDDLRVFLQRRVPAAAAQVHDVETGLELWTERRIVERFGDGRVWLAGDAAHLCGPLATDGLNLGLHEAFDLAGRITRALRGGDAREAMAGYGDDHARAWRVKNAEDARLACLPFSGTAAIAFTEAGAAPL
jgi:2-polyprenyl-6-methoxyphenol hydroxylase-like FAD-dependent oxidoreductase